jgi:hypothetical protein
MSIVALIIAGGFALVASPAGTNGISSYAALAERGPIAPIITFLLVIGGYGLSNLGGRGLRHSPPNQTVAS